MRPSVETVIPVCTYTLYIPTCISAVGYYLWRATGIFSKYEYTVRVNALSEECGPNMFFASCDCSRRYRVPHHYWPQHGRQVDLYSPGNVFSSTLAESTHMLLGSHLLILCWLIGFVLGGMCFAVKISITNFLFFLLRSESLL